MADATTQEPEKASEVEFSSLTGKAGLREGEGLAEVCVGAELGLEARSLMPCLIHSLLDVELPGESMPRSSPHPSLPACTWPPASSLSEDLSFQVLG